MFEVTYVKTGKKELISGNEFAEACKQVNLDIARIPSVTRIVGKIDNKAVIARRI